MALDHSGEWVRTRAALDASSESRGFLGWLPILGGSAVALAGLAAYLLAHSSEHGGTFANHGIHLAFALDGPAWVGPVLTASAIVLVIGGILLAAARDRSALILAVAIVVAGLIPAAVAASERLATSEISPAQFQSLDHGVARADVIASIGEPESVVFTEESSTRGRGCEVYRRSGSDAFTSFYVLCYSDGRLETTLRG